MLDVTFITEASNEGGIYLPVDYRPGFMSIIKSAIESESKIQYELMFNRRTVKPYTFAVSFGNEMKVENDKIFFMKPIEFKFSSFELEYEIYVYNYLVKNKHVNIFNRGFEVSHMRFVKKREIKGSFAIFKTLSPVLIRSHKNQNHYLCPECKNFKGDEDFHEAFKFNLNELARNLLNIEPTKAEFKSINLRKIVVKHMTKYGNLKFPGFVGVFSLEADPHILNLVNKAGLGSRRGEGFGMVELIYEGT